MSGGKKGETMINVATRFSAETLARLDALRPKMSPKGVALTRSDAVRIAVAHGLYVLENPTAPLAPMPTEGSNR